MNPILISNIGNRNLKYKGKYISFYTNNAPEFQFRSFTQKLSNSYESDIESFELAILPPLIEAFIEAEGNQIILYVTNQPDSHPQDTVFAGIIIQKILQLKYPNLNVFIKEITCDLVKESELLCTFYQSVIRDNLTNNSAQVFWIGDAGGSPQQQFALRLVSELMIPESQREMKYVALKDTISIIENRSKSDFSKVILAEQSRILIDEGKYYSALSLFNRMGGNKNIGTLLEMAAHRLSGNKVILSIPQKSWTYLDNWKTFQQGEGFEVPNALIDILRKKGYNKAFELLSIAQFYLHIKDYTQFLFHAYLFQEFVVLSIMKLVWDIEEKRSFESIKITLDNKLASYLDQKIVIQFLERNKKKELTAGVVSLLLISPCEPACSNPIIMSLFKDFSQLNDLLNTDLSSSKREGWRILRNSYAHDGNIISEKDLLDSCPELFSMFYNWLKLFEMPEENIYLQFNHVLKNRLALSISFS
jgi:hypothetical protein